MKHLPTITCKLLHNHDGCDGTAERADGSTHPCGCVCHELVRRPVDEVQPLRARFLWAVQRTKAALS